MVRFRFAFSFLIFEKTKTIMYYNEYLIRYNKILFFKSIII